MGRLFTILISLFIVSHPLNFAADCSLNLDYPIRIIVPAIILLVDCVGAMGEVAVNFHFSGAAPAFQWISEFCSHFILLISLSLKVILLDVIALQI